MQCMAVRRLSDRPSQSRYYIDGRRVSRLAWDTAHLWRRVECCASRMEDRKDGSVIVREYHCIVSRERERGRG
jgi:hypothetical protein